MPRRFLLTALVACALCSLPARAEPKRHEVFLPPDTDVLTVTGKGFKLELSHFEDMKQNWQEAAKQSSEVDTPKTLGDSAQAKPAGSGETGQGVQINLLDVGQNEEAQKSAGGSANGANNKEQQETAAAKKDYGFVDRDIQRWVDIRATALIDRLDRYSDELNYFAADEAQKVVVEILQLNTLAQLEDLAAEQIPSLGWLNKKLLAQADQGRINKYVSHSDVSQFASRAVRELVQIEAKTKGTNNPGKQWLKHASALRRISIEQRFAKPLDDYILDIFAREFGMMKRSLVLQILKGTQQVDDGLVYWAAKGRVPADFPFSAQDAIANGAQY